MSSRFRGPAAAAAVLTTALALAAALGLGSMALPGTAHAASVTAPGRHSASARQVVGGTDLASPGIVVNYLAHGAVKLPQVPASAYVIADASTGQVLAAKDAHGLFPPASTLKVLTAITLIPLLNPNATVAASRLATSVEPNVVGLLAGHRYKVSDLFRALLLISANDAAVALTQATGSFGHGMALINAEARRLQAYDVVAKQPNGLPAAGQVVSAYDEALIAQQALAIPAFMQYDSTLAARFPVKNRKWVTLVNQNSLLTNYRGGIGGKIGWTVKSEATYVGMARRHGVTLIVSVLHCTPLQEITSGERLLNWGFAMAGKVAPVGTLVKPLPSVTASRQSAAPAPGQATDGQAGHARAGQVTSSRLTARAAGATPGQHGSSSLPAEPIAIGAGLLAAAAIAVGLGRLAWSRRHPASTGQPPPG